MAEGRLLKKKISRSRKLAELKSDTNRLIYTWILPHLDVEGRIHADPNIIKGEIFPRISSISPEIIDQALKDIEFNKLCIIYKINGDSYLQYFNFHSNQSLRKDREKPSIIPDPPNYDHELFNQDNCNNEDKEIDTNIIDKDSSWYKSLKTDYPELNVDFEFRKFNLRQKDEPNKNLKLAFRNWLNIALSYKNVNKNKVKGKNEIKPPEYKSF